MGALVNARYQAKGIIASRYMHDLTTNATQNNLLQHATLIL
jgi:hypothetical protein